MEALKYWGGQKQKGVMPSHSCIVTPMLMFISIIIPDRCNQAPISDHPIPALQKKTLPSGIPNMRITLFMSTLDSIFCTNIEFNHNECLNSDLPNRDDGDPFAC